MIVGGFKAEQGKGILVKAMNKTVNAMLPLAVALLAASAVLGESAVQRKVELVERGEIATASAAVAIVCSEDVATAGRYEARNDALRSIALRSRGV